MFSRVFISDRSECEQFVEAIRQYRKDWDEKLLKFKDTAVHDWTSHPADMFRYTALVEPQMTNEESTNFEKIMEQNERKHIANPYK
jgi:hypothetical protein